MILEVGYSGPCRVKYGEGANIIELALPRTILHLRWWLLMKDWSLLYAKVDILEVEVMVAVAFVEVLLNAF